MTDVAVVDAARKHIAAAEEVVVRVAAAVRTQPVVAVRADIADRSTIAAARTRQEYCSSSLHLAPFGNGIGVRGEIVRVSSECQTTWYAPTIRKEDVTSLPIDGRLTSEVLGIGTSVVEVVPLFFCQRAPHTRFISTIADGVINAPIIVGDRDIVLSISVVIIVGTSHIRILAIVSAGSPSEEVDPTAIGDRDVFVFVTNYIVLVLGKAPCLGAGLVLQVTHSETYLLGSGDGELAG